MKRQGRLPPASSVANTCLDFCACVLPAEEVDAAGDGEVLVVMDLRPDEELLAAVSWSGTGLK